MHGSLEHFLDEVARRGSWFGGGSAAALTAALSAALLEKLLAQPPAAHRVGRIRRDCAALIQRDADTFARVIAATRLRRRQAFARALKTATGVPCRIAIHARKLAATCRAARRLVKPRLQSDLRCALALANAADAAACALIDTNLVWLNEPGYTRMIRRRLRTAAR